MSMASSPAKLSFGAVILKVRSASGFFGSEVSAELISAIILGIQCVRASPKRGMTEEGMMDEE